jgi:hypothetical protein
MGKARRKKAYRRMMQGSVYQNIRFGDLRLLILDVGYEERVRGSHHVFTKPGFPLLNLQVIDGGKCKGYQVRQVLDVLCQLYRADVAA